MDRKDLKESLEIALNQWMDRFVDNPEQFQHEWQTVVEHVKEREDGCGPTYGASAAEYLMSLLENINV